MENITHPQETNIQPVNLTEEDLTPQVICFDADGKAEGVKLEI